jgi:organic hydroperoxide reductase OsmC/OhrA
VLTSLRYHADRAGIATDASGSARGVVTRRDSDGLYAFVQIEAEMHASLSPQPEPEALAELLAKAERDCFVGASLTVKPTYRWIVGDPG